jgi:plasmid stabilization system protein ParE
MRPVCLSRRAAREWRQLADRLAANNPTAPAELAADLSRIFEAITTFPRGLPEIGRGLRRAVVQSWSLGIYYRVSRHRITVVAIIDLRRDPLAIRSRLGLHEDVVDFRSQPAASVAATSVAEGRPTALPTAGEPALAE